MKRLGQACVLAALVSFGGGALAATSAEVPAEVPPEDFAGRQFVDSEGCVFIRATVDGSVTWVPRLTRERTVLCGFQPTFGGDGVVAAGSLPTPAPDVPPAVDAKPAEALASAAPMTPAPDVRPAPAPAPAASPAPVIVAEATPEPVMRRTTTTRRVTMPRHQGVPAGYRPIWKDDRLNPHRGPRSAAGDAAMAKVWSSDVPMRLLGD